MSIMLKNMTSDELYAALASVGVSRHVARQLQAACVRRDQIPDSIPEVSHKVLGRVRERVKLPQLTRLEKVVSARDGFAKYLFRGDGEGTFETVRIPLVHREGEEKFIVCVSSQVGCAMGCAFCATGRMGFVRNLSTWEMVD